jgi:hypothetical protein
LAALLNTVYHVLLDTSGVAEAIKPASWFDIERKQRFWTGMIVLLLFPSFRRALLGDGSLRKLTYTRRLEPERLPISTGLMRPPTMRLFERIRLREINMRAEYVWEEVYKAAIVETDDGELPNRIQAAKAAIDNRLHDLQMDHGRTPEERQAIRDALAGLIILRRELERHSSEERSSKS